MKYAVVIVATGEVLAVRVPLTRGEREAAERELREFAFEASKRGRGGTRVALVKQYIDRAEYEIGQYSRGRVVSE